MVEVQQAAAAISDSSGSATTFTQAVAPPPPPQRRPRVREVSSRFMSPVASSSSSSTTSSSTSSSCGDLHLLTAKSPHFKQQQQRSHRRQHDNSKETESLNSADENRLLETARSLESPFQFQRRHNQPRSLMKLFNDNNGSKLTGRYSNSSRADTPAVATSFSSRSRGLQRSTSNTATAATKLLQSLSSQTCNSSQDLIDDNDTQSGGEKPTPAISRSYSSSVKIGGVPLPPVPPPPQGKPGADAKKGRKAGSSHLEDVHSLKLLHNHYFQWRFANAKAEASLHAQRRETERSLYSLGVKIAELYDSVKKKRIELGILKRMKTLSTIVEAQMPHLDEWCAFEEEYSNSLSEAIQALLNTSIQLPIGGNVKADVREMGEALNSTVKLMEMIMLHLQSFMPKAEEVEMLISELAKVTGMERALIEECGDLLSKTQAFQVEECSLRGQLMQLHHRLLHLPCQLQQDTDNSSLNAVHMR
ncbi:QWRF motif-containing protein 2-like [Melia azedarach]|uniref:QWRF motif-containing protein 2-like n=1 Tax=Melia azedarach TaxID=155640 RepID=A0ACC1WYJ8_MELAZ|nr:QWRF motif-containing protein 2-like [Melia azedarach]